MSEIPHFDVAIAGAGILGLAHAYLLAKSGRKVAVFERGHRATGASVRNFGMVWPIGQPPGEMRAMALRSRDIWLEALGASGIWHRKSGSLHLSYHDDEMAVLAEFVAKGAQYGYATELIGPAEVMAKSPAVRQQGLVGAMWSPSELCVFPRQVIAELPTYLASIGVEFYFGSAMTAVETGRFMAGGQEFRSDQVLLCTGDDFEALFPTRFASLGMTRSKLQMMRARPLEQDFRIGPHLCAGLTLGHYANFRICDGLPNLLERYERELSEHIEWGIHLLVSQHEDGSLTIGDSHEYGLAPTPFLQEQIDRLILAYLDTFLPADRFEVFERWHGVYAKHPVKNYIVEPIVPGVRAVTGVGGAGMTLSFGLAEKVCQAL